MTNEEKKLHRVCLFNSSMQGKTENRTIFYSARNMLSGKGNVELVFREIAASGFADRFTHIVAVPNFGDRFKDFKESFSELDIRFTAFDSDEYVKALAKAKYLISDGQLPLYYIRPAGQKHLCLFNQNRLLFDEDEKGNYRARIFKELSRLVPMTDLMLCANENVMELMNSKLFLDSFYTGRLIRAAEPAFYGAEPAVAEEAPAESSAKYSPERIAELMSRYAPSEEKAAEEKPLNPIPGEVPDRKTSLESIIGALFFGEGSYVEYPRSEKPRIAVTAYLGSSTSYNHALRNFCDLIDKEKYSVTVFAFATSSSGFCSGFGNGTRIIQKDDYTFSAADMEMQAADTDEVSEKTIWKYEVLRSLGSDSFDAVIVFNTVNPFRHRFAASMNAPLRIFAAPSERELLEDYPDPAMLTDLINHTYDRTLLFKGGGVKLAHSGKMPAALWSGWETAADERPEPLVFSDGERRLLALLPSPAAPVGCRLIPMLDKSCENTLCIARDMEDAGTLCGLFNEYADDKPSARMYLCVLTDGEADAARLSDDRITVLPGREIPLLLMKECSRFVYPYEGGSGLETAAALLGADARSGGSAADELLLTAGPAGGTFYSGYAPEAPAGKLIADSSVFDIPPADKGLYEKYKAEAVELICSLPADRKAGMK